MICVLVVSQVSNKWNLVQVYGCVDEVYLINSTSHEIYLKFVDQIFMEADGETQIFI